mgnify:CR=1 FL=1
MLMVSASEKLGPVRLMPGVTRGHTLSYLWAAFVSIGIFTYATSLQPYLLEVNIDQDEAFVKEQDKRRKKRLTGIGTHALAAP